MRALVPARVDRLPVVWLAAAAALPPFAAPTLIWMGGVAVMAAVAACPPLEASPFLWLCARPPLRPVAAGREAAVMETASPLSPPVPPILESIGSRS